MECEMIQYKNLLNKLDNLVLGGVTGEELVDVRHQVDADCASKSVATLQNNFKDEHLLIV